MFELTSQKVNLKNIFLTRLVNIRLIQRNTNKCCSHWNIADSNERIKFGFCISNIMGYWWSFIQKYRTYYNLCYVGIIYSINEI